MRIARIWKKPETLFFSGWMVAVIGGAVFMLVLLFVFAIPWGAEMARVDVEDLPANPQQAASALFAGVELHLMPSGVVNGGNWSADRPCRLRIHGAARWPVIGDFLRMLRRDGLHEVELVVRNRDGTLATLRFDLGGDWPEMADSATAQEFVDSLR